MVEWNHSFSDAHTEELRAFGSLDAIWQLQGQPVTMSAVCEVLRVEVAGRGYYVKRYHRAGDRAWSGLLKSKVRREWENLLRFREWGLPVAEVVAYGEEAGCRNTRRGALVTAEVAGSTDLARLAGQPSPLFADPHWVDQIAGQVAHATAEMHRHKFAHNDWKWRNILVSGSEQQPQITMIDCPAGAFWWGPFFEYRRIKDIACLDKIGHKILTSRQRLKFYKQYRQVTQLSSRDKRDIGKIVRFFSGRE